MSFKTLGLSPSLLSALEKNSYQQPTAVQTKVIPLILEGKDIMAKAQTGSGKSASFVLPILDHYLAHRGEAKKGKIKALVLTPTRELTLQVAQEFETLGADLAKRPQIVTIIGGKSIGDQLYAIQQGCDILVATSGRFLDVLSKKQMTLEYIDFLVLDEADKMLNLGFAEELEAILEVIPKVRQNLLFSATYPQKILDIISKITNSALKITIEDEAPTVEKIVQRTVQVNRENRGPLLRALIKDHEWRSVLVFMTNKRATDNIAAKFRKYGFKANSFHGDLEQDERNYTLKHFKNRNIQILFATDIASRGLDINDIDCVINYDLPRSPADYIHRIGRTGRAGKAGLSISFLDHEDEQHFKLIEKRAEIKLERESIEGFEIQGEAIKKVKGPAPLKGKGKSKKDKLREKARLEAQKR